MQIVKNNSEELPIIYGIITDKTPEGEFMGMAIDSLDGSAIARINGSWEMEVKYVMGFAELSEAVADSIINQGGEFDEDGNGELRHQVIDIYESAFPEGYKLEWIGLWRNDQRTVKLCGWLDGQEIPQDGFFDYVTPDRVVEKNAVSASKAGFKPDPDVWHKKHSKDFYLGMASACRILAGNVIQAKNQKDILQFINGVSLSAMVIAHEKKSGSKLIL